MSLSKKGYQTNETKLNIPSKATSLNPNAAEFVPISLRSSSPSGSNSNMADATAKFTSSGMVGKVVLNRSESSVSNTSDEEAHQYWHHQLPDDITPDFKFMSEDESQGLGGISLAGLSLCDGTELSRFPASRDSGYLLTGLQELSLCSKKGSEKRGYSTSYREDQTSGAFLNLPTKPWEKQIVNSDRFLGKGRESHPYNLNSRQGFMNDVLGEHSIFDDTDMNPLEFLASHFPGFAAESCAEVYFASGCNLNLTIEMLTQLELQVDGGFNQSINSKTLLAPNLNVLDIPALTAPQSQNGPSRYAGNDIQKSRNPCQSFDEDNIPLFKPSASFPSRSAIDFASAVRKLVSQDSGSWKYDRNGSADPTVGSSRNSHVLASAYNSGNGRGIYSEASENHGSALSAPFWLETGEAVGNIPESKKLLAFMHLLIVGQNALCVYICFNIVEVAANMYSELREEARDHAHLRNAYFEQARQAYLVGNKALAKELSVKGQLHDMHMKAAHGKAQESIYGQRNPVGPQMQGNGRGLDRMIDLHGLHVSEALQVLRHELNVLRSTAQAAEQRLQVCICVGTGHHTRGSRTLARLPIAVQRYLREEEGLDYSEPQPGLLRVLIY